MNEPTPTGVGSLDVARLRRDFPILARTMRGRPLVYLDNAASTQKPRAVIAAVESFYSEHCSNVHRGLYELSTEATALYEGAREKVARLIGAREPREIVFTRGTTEAINLVAYTYGQLQVAAGDEILVTHMEHHSNIVPWQLLCERVGAVLRVVPIDDSGDLDLDAFRKLLSPRTRLIGVVHTSNALGTRNPVERICAEGRERGVPVLIDGAQALSHEPVDVQAMGCDFLAFSGHKMHGPTGIGGLYGRAELLEKLPPFQGGGEMIHSVTFAKTTYRDIPGRFEAGTPDIAGAIGLGAAVDYLEEVGLERIAEAEHELTEYALQRIAEVPGLRLIGTPQRRGGIVSFVIDDIHPHDVGTVLDMEGVAVRAGHHCAQPVMERYGVPATVRASFALYNTGEEIDALVVALQRAIEVFDR